MMDERAFLNSNGDPLVVRSPNMQYRYFILGRFIKNQR